MKHILFFIIAFVVINADVFAQRKIPPELAVRLQGKTKVVEIMTEVNRYYDFGKANIESNAEEFEGNDYHWWKKWEYWAMRRLNPDGSVADYRGKNYEARLQMEQKFGTQMRQAEAEFRNARKTGDRVNAEGMRSGTYNRSYGGWSSIGPFDGGTVVGSGTNIDINGLARMDRISFHPTDANTFYVCSPSGGIFKTTTGGSSWSAIGDGLPSGAAAIEVAPSNGNVIYVFSGDGDSHQSGYLVFNYLGSPSHRGMFRSSDGGNTWIKLTDIWTGVGDIVGHNIAVSQNNSNFVFVATDKGLYRTIDGGNNWEQVRSGDYWDVEFRPHDDSTVYTSTSSTVQYSDDGGRSGTWTSSTFDFAPTANRIDLAVRRNTTAVQSTFVYALAGDAFAGSFRGLYLSSNIGVSFTRQCNSPNILGSTTLGSDGNDQTAYDMGICVKPTDPNYVVTASLCVWRSNGSNGGTSMVYSSTYREGLGPLSAFIHPDVHDVQYNPLNNFLYACTDGGVYRSNDDGVTWTNLSSGLVGSQFYHMRMKDVDGDGEMEGLEIICGAQDNGIKYRTSLGEWRHIVCCDGYDGVIKGSAGDYLVMTFNDVAYRTSNGGVNMTFMFQPTFFSPFAIDYDFDDTMYMASSSLRRSYTGFTTNTTIATNLNNFITTCPSNNARLYGSSNSKTNLRISEDRGDTWTTISGNTGWPAGSPVVTDCKPWLSFSGEIYATFAGYTAGVKVYRSTDAGVTWSNYSGSLPNVPVLSCATSPEGVYVGTDIGVFFRPDGAADWTPFYTGMPNVSVTDLWVNENGNVYAGTFGRGVWFAERYSACDPTVTVSGTLDGPHYYEASSIANVTANSQSGENTNIFVKSNGYIDLLPGFEIKDGTFFKAYLGPCSTGGIPITSRFASGHIGPDVTNLVEYDDKDVKTRRKETGMYYAFVGDGIEVNLPAGGILEVEIVNKQTNESKSLVNKVKLIKGMYKVRVMPGNYSIKLTVNGSAIKFVSENLNGK